MFRAYWSGPSAIPQTLRLLGGALSDDTILESQAGTELANDLGSWYADFDADDELAQGTYKASLVRTSDSAPLGRGYVTHDGSAEVSVLGGRVALVEGADVGATAEEINDLLSVRHGSGPWGGSGSSGGRSSRNPAAGWEGRSGSNYESVELFFAPADVGGAVQRITVEHAFKREVDATTAAAAGITIQTGDCVWNIPTVELAGLDIVAGTRIVQRDGTSWSVAAEADVGKGVYGEEVRPVCHREL